MQPEGKKATERKRDTRLRGGQLKEARIMSVYLVIIERVCPANVYTLRVRVVFML